MVVADILNTPLDCKASANLNSSNPLNHQPRTISDIRTFFPESNSQKLCILFGEKSHQDDTQLNEKIERIDPSICNLTLKHPVATSAGMVLCGMVVDDPNVCLI